MIKSKTLTSYLLSFAFALCLTACGGGGGGSGDGDEGVDFEETEDDNNSSVSGGNSNTSSNKAPTSLVGKQMTFLKNGRPWNYSFSSGDAVSLDIFPGNGGNAENWLNYRGSYSLLSNGENKVTITCEFSCGKETWTLEFYDKTRASGTLTHYFIENGVVDSWSASGSVLLK